MDVRLHSSRTESGSRIRYGCSRSMASRQARFPARRTHRRTALPSGRLTVDRSDSSRKESSNGSTSTAVRRRRSPTRRTAEAGPVPDRTTGIVERFSVDVRSGHLRRSRRGASLESLDAVEIRAHPRCAELPRRKGAAASLRPTHRAARNGERPRSAPADPRRAAVASPHR